MTAPKVAIDIAANDKTAKGSASAEKRLGAIPKHVSAVNRRALADDERRVARSGRATIRTFGAVEQAAARALGNRSITAGAVSRIAEVRTAASALGTGMGEAAAGGGMLSGALGVVGVAAGATIGVLAAAAYGAFKLADGWAKGAATIGRTAEIMGVATKAMQEFTAAGERVGVDKAAGAGALGSLNQTLNDARYGRNNDAIALLARMGVQMKLKADGTADTEAMLPQIADAIARQNSSGRRTASRILGISEAAMPIFTQGGKALSADMKDAGEHAGIVSDDDVATGKRIVRKGAMVSQMKDRVMLGAGATAAGVTERGYDAVLSGGQAILDGSKDFGGTVRDTFRPAAERIDRASKRMVDAAEQANGVRGAGRLTPGQVAQKARQGAHLIPKLMNLGLSRNRAIALAANAAMESGANYRAHEKGGNGVGLFQITDKARKALFRRVIGVDVGRASEQDQLRYAVWELSHSEKKNWQRAHANGDSPSSIADGYARYVERPKEKARDGAERAAVAGAMDGMSINLTVSGLPRGTSVEARGGRGAKPAVSRAFAD